MHNEKKRGIAGNIEKTDKQGTQKNRKDKQRKQKKRRGSKIGV